MSDLIRRAREALVDVTPGPWAVGVTEEDYAKWFDVRGVPDADGWATVVSDEIDLDADARFIAAARDLVPAMVDRLEAQEALLREAMAVLERCPPTSNPTLTAEYNLERIEAWWRLEVRPVLAKP